MDYKQMNKGYKDLWDYNKSSKIHVLRVLEREEKDIRAEKIYKEPVAEISLNLAKDIKLHIQEAT